MKAPVHLWIVGVLSLVWNAGGAFDYLMVQLQNPDYLAQMTEPQRAYLDTAPTWFKGTWAIGVWFSVLGSILLLARSRLASMAFGLSILGLNASAIYSYGLASPSAIDLMGPRAMVMTMAIVVILLCLWSYARAMKRRGVLR